MNQVAKLLGHLIDGNVITGLIAERNYGIERLPSRIHDLKTLGGYDEIMLKKYKVAPGSRKRYVEYSIEPECLPLARAWAAEDFPQHFGGEA